MRCYSMCALGPYRCGLGSLSPVSSHQIVSLSAPLPGLHLRHLYKSHLAGTCIHPVISSLSSMSHIYTNPQCPACPPHLSLPFGTQCPQLHVRCQGPTRISSPVASSTIISAKQPSLPTSIIIVPSQSQPYAVFSTASTPSSSQPHTVNHSLSDITVGTSSFSTLVDLLSAA